MLYGGAILDNNGKMIGSVMLMNDMNEQEVKKYVVSISISTYCSTSLAPSSLLSSHFTLLHLLPLLSTFSVSSPLDCSL